MPICTENASLSKNIDNLLCHFQYICLTKIRFLDNTISNPIRYHE